MNLPEAGLRIRETGGKAEVYDQFRKHWVKLTPEEWVRQHFVCYLTRELRYPTGLIALEKQITVLGCKRRFDIVVHDARGKPVLLVECKSPKTRIDQSVLDQAGRYNITLNVPYLCVTNGFVHLCCKKKPDQTWVFLDHLPDFDSIQLAG